MGSPTPVSRYMPQNSKKRAFTAESSSSGYAGVDLPELSPAINRASKPKLSKQDELHISMDRLSVLPDDIVFHILSFLPTKNSIRTSLLAKRWRYLWAHLPCFGFTKITTDYNQITPLHNLVNAFLIGVGTSNNEFESWIETLLQRKVRDLVIGLNYQLKLPRRLFTCESLVYLRILDCGYIPKDGAVSFPSLKKLELINVVYDFEDPLIHLLSRCPVLEELMIERMKVLYCNVSSPSLTSLVIDVDEVGWIRLQTPSLRYLRLRDPACESIKAGPMTSLIEADIDIKLDGRIIYSRCLIDFVNSLCNVECLKLSTCPMDDKTPFFSDEVVKFHNLTHLNLRTDWRFVAGFLENANNLRVLTILRMDGYKTQCWKEPKQVPECLTTQHLELVSIVDFGWSAKHEFDFVKYILKDAIVLKKMDIVVGSRHYEVDSNAKRESMNRLLRRSRLLR